jgi:hypothetical protein
MFLKILGDFMGKENYMKYYLNYPIKTSVGVSPYCVRLLEWDDYIKIASRYLTICEDLIRRRLKLNDEWKLLDYVVLVALNESNGIENLERMFSMAFRKPVKAFIKTRQGNIDLHSTTIVVGDYEIVEGELVAQHKINRDNYKEIREIMMEQAFLFDPLIGADERSQNRIDRAIQKKIEKANKNGGNPNIESMLVLNSSRFQIDLETYTYYQLKAQYSLLNREQVAMMYNICRPHGKDIPIINFADELDIHDNPFSFEKMFRKDNGSVGD